MKDYSNWVPNNDYDNHSPYLENKNRPWLKYFPETMPKAIKFDPIPVHTFARLNAERYANNVCVYFKPKDKYYTYRDFLHISDQTACALDEIGVKKSEGVAIMTPNCPEFLFCTVGILETGATVVPINALLREDSVIHITSDAGNIKTIFVHKNNYPIIQKAQKVVDIENVILIGAEKAEEGTVTYEEFINGKPPKAPQVEIDPSDDVASLLYTGGTTGLPKGVMLTHNNLVANALSVIYASRDQELEREDTSYYGTGVRLAVLPLCHSFGFIVSLVSLHTARMLVMLSSFNPPEVLETIEYFRSDQFVGVPVMYQMLINSPDFTRRDLSSLQEASCGSAALAPELNKRWEEILGFKVMQGYGLTEASPVTHGQARWSPEIIPASIGMPIIDTDAKIVNPDTLEELPIGEVGELLIKGPQIMKGYWNNTEATAETLVGDWLRTGDLTRMDERGYFYIEGRTKDMIKYKGYKVMPKEVEEKLHEHPAVLEAGVVPAPDPNIGETIKAFIALKPEYKGKLSEQDIIEWSKDKMAAYKYPRQIEFVESLPRTAVGKIFRRILREREMEKK
ncbi:MAG: AMP-binding protein [Promethearchaeota archaeon]